MTKDYYVLSYYCFTPIEDIESFREEHHKYCLEKNLRGRIKIASEGINGKLSGKKEDCEAYLNDLMADPRFKNTQCNIEEHTGYASEKLHVRLKKEIVNAGLPHIKPYEKTGAYVTPKEFEKMIQRDDVVIVDVRSDYEHSLGKFKGSITFDIGTFREFPDHVKKLTQYSKKKIITVCTSDIKCEKASAYLLTQGFDDVYQLQGGIIRYGKETDGSAFEGTCYVFDNRLSQEINTKKPTVISKCYVCHNPSKRMVNCANMVCNRHVPICEPCGEKLQGACSADCQKSPQKRMYDGTGYYTKKTNGYDPYKGAKRAASTKQINLNG